MQVARVELLRVFQPVNSGGKVPSEAALARAHVDALLGSAVGQDVFAEIACVERIDHQLIDLLALVGIIVDLAGADLFCFLTIGGDRKVGEKVAKAIGVLFTDVERLDTVLLQDCAAVHQLRPGRRDLKAVLLKDRAVVNKNDLISAKRNAVGAVEAVVVKLDGRPHVRVDRIVPFGVGFIIRSHVHEQAGVQVIQNTRAAVFHEDVRAVAGSDIGSQTVEIVGLDAVPHDLNMDAVVHRVELLDLFQRIGALCVGAGRILTCAEGDDDVILLFVRSGSLGRRFFLLGLIVGLGFVLGRGIGRGLCRTRSKRKHHYQSQQDSQYFFHDFSSLHF